MNADDVMTLLEQHANPRGIANWHDETLTSFGIGLTQLRKLARQVGRNRELAQELWASDNYDAKVLGLLIDDPKRVTREQAERQVEQLHQGMLAHVFSSCDATLAKTPFVVELVDAWIPHADPIRRKCGYGLLYEVSKSRKKSAPDEAWFLGHVAHMASTWEDEAVDVRLAIGGALLGVGKRTVALNAASLALANAMGPIVHSATCDPFDTAKHLTSEYTRKRLGLEPG